MRTMLVGLSVLLLAGTALAQESGSGSNAASPATTQSTQARSGSKLNIIDRTFIDKAAQSDMLEIEASKLVEERSKRDDVKRFAARMVQDHGQSSQKLTGLVTAMGDKLPTELDNDHKAKLLRLRDATAGQLDEAYIKMQQAAHQTAIELFEKQAKEGQNAQLKSFAQDTLPILHSHHEAVEALAQGPVAQGGSAARSGSSGSTGGSTGSSPSSSGGNSR